MVGDYATNFYDRRAQVMAINWEGVVSWRRIYFPTVQACFYKVADFGAGRYLAVGSSSPQGVWGPVGGAILLALIEAEDGDLLASKAVQEPGCVESVLDLTIGSDGEALVLTALKKNGVDYGFKVSKFDQQLNLRFSKVFELPILYGGRVYADENGYWVVAGSYTYFPDAHAEVSFLQLDREGNPRRIRYKRMDYWYHALAGEGLLVNGDLVYTQTMENFVLWVPQAGKTIRRTTLVEMRGVSSVLSEGKSLYFLGQPLPPENHGLAFTVKSEALEEYETCWWPWKEDAVAYGIMPPFHKGVDSSFAVSGVMDLEETEGWAAFVTKSVYCRGKDIGSEAEITVYPQPSSGVIGVDAFFETTRSIHLEVYDVAGRLMVKKVYDRVGLFRTELDLSGLDAGIYVLALRSGEEEMRKRFVIAR